MKDPLQIGTTPYEVLDVDQYADRKIIQKAFIQKVQGKAGNSANQARKTLLSPIKRAFVDIFLFSPKYLQDLLPKIREPKHLTGKRKDVAAMWNKVEVNKFPSVGSTHSLAVLWYWWARYITESERIKKIKTVSKIHSVKDLATDYTLRQLWENSVSRWVMLLNSDEFLSSFEFTKGLNDSEKEELKTDIYQHFIGLFSEYGHKYQKAGLKDESEEFNYLSIMFKSEYEAAKLLVKVKTVLPKGFSCGRLFLTNVRLTSKANRALTSKAKNDLKQKETDDLILLLSDDFHHIPLLFSEKQFSACDQAIRKAVVSKGMGSSPRIWLKSISSLPATDKRQMQVIIKYFAKVCYQLGCEYLGASDIDKACEMFSLTKAMDSGSVKPDDISDECITFLNEKASHNTDLALFYIDRILKRFKHAKLFDYKAEMLKEKAHNLSRKIIIKFNEKLDKGSHTRDDLIRVTENYREVIQLDEKAVETARSNDTKRAATARLIDHLLDNHLMLTNAIVENVVSQLNGSIEGIKKQIDNSNDYLLDIYGPEWCLSKAIEDSLHKPGIIQAMMGLNIYYDSDKLEFLHALFEMRYGTALLRKYAFSDSDVKLMEGINELKKMGHREIFGQNIDVILANKKIFKYNDEDYWINAIKNYIMFAEIANAEKRYKIYVMYREGNYSGASKDYKREFGTSSGVNKIEHRFYKDAELKARFNAHCAKARIIELSAFQRNASISIAIDAAELHRKISSFKGATGVSRDTRTESLKMLENAIESILRKQLENGDFTKEKLSLLVDLIGKLQKQKIKTGNLDEIAKNCVTQLFDILVKDINKKSEKVKSSIDQYIQSSSYKPNKAIVRDIDEIDEYYIELKKLVTEHKLDKQILDRCKAKKTEIAMHADRYYIAYAEKCYEYIKEIISKNTICNKQIEAIETEASECKDIIGQYLVGTKKNKRLTTISNKLEEILRYQEIEYYKQTLTDRRDYNKAIKVYLSEDYALALELFNIILKNAEGDKFTTLIRDYISSCSIALWMNAIEDAGVEFRHATTRAKRLKTITQKKIAEIAKDYYAKIATIAEQKEMAVNNCSYTQKTKKEIEKCKKAARALHSKYKESLLILSEDREYWIYTLLNDALESGDYKEAIDQYNKYSNSKRVGYTVINNLYVQLLLKAMDKKINDLEKQDKKYKQSIIDFNKKQKAEMFKKIKKTSKIRNIKGGCFTMFVLVTIISVVLGSIYGWYLGAVLFIALSFILNNLFIGKCNYKGCKNKVNFDDKNAHKVKYEKNGKQKEITLYLCSTHKELNNISKNKMAIPENLMLLNNKINQYINEIQRIDRSINIREYINCAKKIISKYEISQ